MARLPRFNLPDYPQHVIQRGIEGERILLDEDDYWQLWQVITEGATRFGCAVHAYTLMPDHFHLLVTPSTDTGIGRLVQNIGRRYVDYFNSRHERKGALWGYRYRATVLQPDEYLLAVSRYVELNAVRTELVDRPEDYEWSSFAANACCEADELVTPHPVYLILGKDRSERCEHYRHEFDSSMSIDLLEEIRRTTNKAWVLGNPSFCDHIETLIGRRARPLARGGDRRSAAYQKSRAATH